MTFREYLKENIVYLDGGMGTLLQARGLKPGQYPEMWNITHPDIIRDIHKAYFDAGSNVVNTNTFGANTLKFSENELEKIIAAAIKNARDGLEMSTGMQEKFVSLDIGPSGKLLKPYGDLDFEDAVELFAKVVRYGTKYGADLITIETMNDSYETKAALLAAKENSSLPVIVTNAYGEDGLLMTGASPEAMAAMLEGMGADAIGANCSLGPEQLRGVMERLLACASVPVVLKPNAGLPRSVGGKTVYDVMPEEFALSIKDLTDMGVRVIGGCCGTTPEYIKTLVQRTKECKIKPLTDKNITAASSYTHRVMFGSGPVLIGERINPTGKKRLKKALMENDMDYILNEAISQQEKGAHILDVNVGIPDINEKDMLKEAVCQIQTVSDLPLQIDTSNVEAMEAALRRYNGKAMVNSVNGKMKSMEEVFPLVKKYGGLVVALTLDENGIPDTAEGRVKIAEKILQKAKEYGIEKKDIVFDTLAMTISADNKAALVCLEAMRRIKYDLGCHVIVGLSNISFGLPSRDVLNGVFFAMALENGLSGAIMNPNSSEMMKTYYAYRALRGLDENCLEYIEKSGSFTEYKSEGKAAFNVKEKTEFKSALQRAIVKGLKDQAGEITKELLNSEEPLYIVQNEVIPALDIVGEGFEKGRVYLPQLLMSAEAAKSAFEHIKSALPPKEKQDDDFPIIIATVYGDIHDIGKNIVKLLLENYGFSVYDLGKDVPPEKILEETVRLKAPLVGLSALMTTTVPSMEKTICLLRKEAPWCRVVVGGAVLNREYAEKIGADKYAKDAMESVRYAEEIKNQVKK